MGRYLQLIAMSRSCEISEVSQGPVLNSLNSQMQPGRRGEFHAALRALDARCPERVHDHRRWRQAVTDGEAFLARWGEQALLLAWTVDDLYGLHPIAPLARYDHCGPRQPLIRRLRRLGTILATCWTSRDAPKLPSNACVKLCGSHLTT
jgi:hypothetical protein